MSNSLFERTSLQLCWNTYYDKNGTQTYYRSLHVHILWKGTRRGVSYISNRYSKASNKYLKSYHRKQESKHIVSSRTNNLHGYAMSKFLPTSDFKWIDPKEFDLNKYTSNSSRGCVLEVDL